MTSFRLALAQMNAVVGDVAANVATIARLRRQASGVEAQLMLTPELALTGYPPEDLLLKDGFVAVARHALGDLVTDEALPPTLVGTVASREDGIDVAEAGDGRPTSRTDIANAAILISPLGVGPVAVKRLLPNYDVFDEQRYFRAGVGPETIITIDGVSIGVLICEDVWRENGPALALAQRGAQLLVVLNASPFARGRQREREAMLQRRALETGCPIAYVNLVGGQDELVFDGQSVVVNAVGDVIARARACEEELLVVDVPLGDGTSTSTGPSRSALTTSISAPLSDVEVIYRALVTGTRDYLRKNGFRSALLGLSGGVDSALVATIAVDALGARAVRAIAMPSRYSSDHSLVDAYDIAQRLDIDISTVPIEPAHAALEAMLSPALGEWRGLTEENLQSRIRGLLLMALSNNSGAIVLTTGNKSEMATGYSTLYGDSAGGFAVIKDVPKTLVYELCHYRNQRALDDGDVAPIPDSVLTKAPSAELRPGQRDDQSLPPYDVLDPLLARYIDEDATAAELIDEGADPEVVMRITRLVDLSEYKRRQMPPGVRISGKAFGRDRRMPISNGFRSDPM